MSKKRAENEMNNKASMVLQTMNQNRLQDTISGVRVDRGSNGKARGVTQDEYRFGVDSPFVTNIGNSQADGPTNGPTNGLT